MNWHEYLEAPDVHLIDCSGKVDLATGLARLDQLSLAFEAHPPRAGVRRVLIDFRETEWDTAATHQALSIATRERFNLTPHNASIVVAIVNQHWQGCRSDNEHWFFEKQDALHWLSETNQPLA